MRILIGLAIAMFICGFAAADIYLDDISVTREGDSVIVDITTTKPCLYEHFMIKDAPEKIVVDLQGTINDWPKKSFTNLSFNSIERIRTSQFQAKPAPVSRVVLDINRSIGYRVEELPMGVRVKIPASENEIAFTTWNVGQVLQSAPKVAVAKKEEAAPDTVKPKPAMKLTNVEDFPKRKAVRYQAKNSRDPFRALVGLGTNLMAGQIPAVENLTLVGVFDDETGRKALFEDSEGIGFLLRANDRVQNGYLVSIQKDKAVFQVTEYGWTRTVALKLQIPELK